MSRVLVQRERESEDIALTSRERQEEKDQIAADRLQDELAEAESQEERDVLFLDFIRLQRATGMREAHTMMTEWFDSSTLDVEEAIEELEVRADEIEEGA